MQDLAMTCSFHTYIVDILLTMLTFLFSSLSLYSSTDLNLVVFRPGMGEQGKVVGEVSDISTPCHMIFLHIQSSGEC